MRLAPLLTLGLMLLARQAAASPGTTGFSGKPYPDHADSCTTSCHTGGGAAPAVDITFPATIKAGESGTVKVVINGTRARTSMNAAFSEAVKASAGQNTSIPFEGTPDEVAAKDPPPSGKSGTYTFSFVAPQKNGPLTLYLAAMSADGTGRGGDGVAVTTRTITVTGATTTPTEPEPTEGSTSGNATPAPGSSSGSKKKPGTTASTDDASDDDDDDTTTNGRSRRLPTASADAGGCSAASAPCGAPATLGAALGLALVVRRRRRQRTDA